MSNAALPEAPEPEPEPVKKSSKGKIVDDPELLAMDSILRTLQSLPCERQRKRVTEWLYDKWKNESE